MKKKIPVSEFANELMLRLEKNQSVDCCRDELINLAKLAKAKIGGELVEVNWKD